MIKETKRLILRPWRDDDAEDLFTYAIVAPILFAFCKFTKDNN